MRKPVVAGQFYPQTEASLKKMLAGLVVTGSEKQEVKGVILPHAGYVYSGSVAGATISKVEIKKTAVILGTDHTGAGSPFSIATKGSWLTPLGEVKIDYEIAESILKTSELLKDDSRGHAGEHSIEVELPFLQYVRGDIKIVPIIISRGDIKKYQQLAIDIVEGFKKVGRSAIFIASTDFTHYESKESAEAKDRLAIEAIVSLDEERLFRVIEENKISMCGSAPTCVLLSACKKLGAKQAGLVKYQTSGDITGDYSSVVGYAGMVLW
ncbi:MAG: AmmeMemoRadiSam system protein B [Candidatus Omnitrophica bacterium]|nr:AmmeMemoRadiSam system protein B [Candidatus Omnitrophota bacterium]